MGFSTEKDLVRTALSSAYFRKLAERNTARSLVEVRGLFGVPDLVIATVNKMPEAVTDIHAMAFEMKLCKWQRALIQAYRYRSFARKSYVVMDHARIKPALKRIDRFIQSNVGLLSINQNGEVYTHFDPGADAPYCAFTRACFEEIVIKECCADDRVVRTQAVQFPLPLTQAG